jgi:WD40 repeat protein
MFFTKTLYIMKGRATIFLITLFLSIHFAAFTQAIRIGIPSGHTDFLRCAVFSPDGKYILTASDDCTAKIWDVTSGKLLHNLTGHSSKITSAQYSPDGKKIVTASEDNTARVWDASTGKLLFVLKGHSGRVNSASFNPNNTTIVTASLDGTLKLWNSNTGGMIHSSENSGSSADLAQYSPDGKYIASALEGPAIEIFESSTAGMIRGIQEFGLITSLKFSPAFPGKSSWSNELLITTEYQRTSLWDFKTGKLIQSFAHEAPVYEACFSPDGKYLATAGGKNIKVWDRSNGKLIRTLEGHTDDVRSVEFSPACADDPSGGRYIVSASYDRTAKIYDSRSGELLFNLTGHNDLVWEAHFSPDGRYIITASFDHTARLWNRSNGKLVNILEGHTAKVLSARFSPATTEDPTGGKYAVTSISGGRAESWESNSGKPFHIYGIPSDTAYDAYFSPDGLSVAVTCIHDHLKMYESSGNLRYNITGHKGYIKSVEFSPSTEEYPAGGKYMTTASYDNTASIWDTDSGNWISTMGHDYYIYSAKFSPDGNYIATASADGTASIWTVEGYYRQSFGNSSSSYIRPVYMAEFSPPDQEDPAGGKYLLTAESTDKAVIWESSSGEQVRTLEGHFDNVWSARYSSDGKFIVTASDDSTSIYGRIVQEICSTNSEAIREV